MNEMHDEYPDLRISNQFTDFWLNSEYQRIAENNGV